MGEARSDMDTRDWGIPSLRSKSLSLFLSLSNPNNDSDLSLAFPKVELSTLEIKNCGCVSVLPVGVPDWRNIHTGHFEMQ